MPKLGDIKKSREIYHPNCKSGNKHIWAACPKCGKERWVVIRQGVKAWELCIKCALASSFLLHRRGPDSPAWKGGRHKVSSGHIKVWLSRDDFFLPMAQSNGYVLEHRLVTAKHLRRCLLPWEIVHHKNGVKDDNRLENLELITGRRFHLVDAVTKNTITRLRKENALLKEKLKKLL